MEEKATAKADQSDGNDALDIEPLLQALGPRGLGLYQLSQMVLQLLNLFGVAFTVLGVVFIGKSGSLSLSLPVCLPACLSVCLSVCLCLSLSLSLSLSLPDCLSLSVCLSPLQ